MMGQILIDMSVFWNRSGVQGMRPPSQKPRRLSRARSYQPLRGGTVVVRGHRCERFQGRRIAAHTRLATNNHRAVKTGPIIEHTT